MIKGDYWRKKARAAHHMAALNFYQVCFFIHEQKQEEAQRTVPLLRPCNTSGFLPGLDQYCRIPSILRNEPLEFCIVWLCFYQTH
jgi:hypothetical protein